MTELIWEGKYDKDGKKTAPLRIALPFQTIETVNESAADRQKTLDLFAQGKPTEWRNRLIWGDKKYVLPSLLPEFAGKVNLIYIDPPFDTGADFSFSATIPDNPETEENETTTFTKQPSIIEQKAYRDTWGRGLDSYLQWFYETVVLLRELLAEDGSIYVHLDWRMIHYAKIIMDEIFGYENFRNMVIWKRATMSGAKAVGGQFGRNYDSILFYSKNSNVIFNRQYLEYSQDYIDKKFIYREKDGRRYRLQPKGTRSNQAIEELRKQGRIIESESGYIQIKFYLDEMKGVVLDDVWLDIQDIRTIQGEEKLNYPTQKPELLIERIIKTSSNEGDLVLDCFCGSGTTPAVAEKLNRRWIACDLGRFAIHTTRKRLLGIPGVRPFVVQNLGKYERQQWLGAEFQSAENKASVEQQYRHFILQLYHAVPLSGYTWLHGVKAGRLVHVSSVEAPVTITDIKNMVQEFWKIVGKESQ
ncbi:MAG: site-specific DNA-methyltransferase, partial [candidate division KSB1 bacterium]|nr:site-specific DNA-methyltransferase [candidate division KSB1 bacterium]